MDIFWPSTQGLEVLPKTKINGEIKAIERTVSSKKKKNDGFV